jgi:hypothetical protein
MRRERSSLVLLSILFMAIISMLLSRQGWAAEIPLSADQMIALSRQIVVVLVEREQARWNEQHTLIVTDYFLRVESRLRGQARDHVKLTMPGGTLDGETHSTSLSVNLRTGERYLLFCRDLGQSHMAPITGSWQGVFHEIRTPDGPSRVEPGEGASALAVSGKMVTFADFVNVVRDLVRKAAPPDSAAVVMPGWTEVPKDLPAKVYSPLAPPPAEKLGIPETSLQPETVPPPSRRDMADFLVMKADSAGPTRARAIPGNFVWQRRPGPPVVFNQLPGSFSPWSPNDQSMMGYWNLYASSLFLVYQSPSGTWAWGNGIYDIAGFPSDADMVSQFGNAWGPNILAVTYSRWFDNGPIVESDVAVNPHFSWTTDDALATTATSPAQSFRQTILHELGHTWGLQHPWETQRVWWDSVMNYAPKVFRLTKLYSDDTAAVRSAYPGTSIHDGLLSNYLTDFGSDNNPFYAASEPTAANVPAGGTFQMSQSITLENVGTDNVVNPEVEVYLTPHRLSFDGAVYLTTFRYTGVVQPFPNAIQQLPLGPLTIPPRTPSGSYAVAFFLRDNTDGFQGNNSAWSNNFIQVQGDPNLSCNSDAKTLCIDDQPGDRRFKVTVDYNSRTGGSGSATAISLSSLGVVRGGLFWFFSPENPELLVKVLDGCALNNNYWVFASAGTNIGLSITVTDTLYGRQRNYRNNDGTPASPIQDTQAFTCTVR